MSWMLYGATGYTGTLLAEEAVRRRQAPLLAGRDAARLRPLAERLGLEWAAVSLDDAEALARAVGGVELVLHAAGPFVRTSAPMIEACLAAGAHYADITAEIPVFRHAFAQDARARERGVALVPGAGFDVIPTDCLACHVVAQVPGAVELQTAIAPQTPASAGTGKSALGMLAEGGLVRRDGRLVPLRLGSRARRIPFPDRPRTCIPAPWGDLESAYRSTGIAHITAYMAVSSPSPLLMRLADPLARPFLAHSRSRRALEQVVERCCRGPDEALRTEGRSYIWARAADAAGNEAQAWLETMEPYRFTAVAGVRAVERLLESRPVGALTPAQAFGADFVLELPETQRFDRLPGQ